RYFLRLRPRPGLEACEQPPRTATDRGVLLRVLSARRAGRGRAEIPRNRDRPGRHARRDVAGGRTRTVLAHRRYCSRTPEPKAAPRRQALPRELKTCPELVA